VNAGRLTLRLLPGRVDARDMTEPDVRRIKVRGDTAEGEEVSFRSGSEGTEVERVLSGGPDGIDSVDKVLVQSQRWRCVSRLEYLVKLRELRVSRPVTKTDLVTIVRS